MPEQHLRFINHSPAIASDQDLENWWIEAQQSPIFVNQIAVILNPSVIPDVRPADARASSVQPENIDFTVVPDSPNGFPCPGTLMPICFGETFYTKDPIVIRISDADVHKIAVYEFQNVIIWKLGYPMKER
jgi:hypothetical protein